MIGRLLERTLVGAVILTVVCLSGVAHAQQKFVGVSQPGAPPVGTEEPCILNPCLMYSGDFNPNGQNPDGLWNANNTTFGILGTVVFVYRKDACGEKVIASERKRIHSVGWTSKLTSKKLRS